MTSKYLIEIGVEELPATQVDDALNQFSNLYKKYLTEEDVSFGEVESYATPRRLTLIISDLSKSESDEMEEVKGPAKKICFGEDGSISKAFSGFLNSKGLEEKDVFFREIKGVEYAYANVVKKSKSLEEVLSEIAPKAIKGISFPKSMRWGGKDIRFARPIRWLISLLNDKVIPFDLEGIKVSNETYGHRFLSKGKIKINTPDEYVEKLKDAYVIVNQDERKDIIIAGANRLAREKAGNIQKDEDLLNEVVYIIEYPTCLIGRIKEQYMELPDIVIITPMKEHLRYFPVVDDDEKLMPYFVTVRNGNEDHIDIVTHGNQMVLDPRLEDAKFFYNEDSNKPLIEYVDDLKTVVFQEKLGTLYDKTKRLEILTEKYAKFLSVGVETIENVVRAATLSKADLSTKLVIEFTELQGKMGRIYAKNSGENDLVSVAIEEQYLPRFAGDLLPETTAGTLLSLADKFDTISGMFAVGIRPTGSVDPFALRRAAIGIINIILDTNIDIRIENFINDALYVYVEEQGLTFDYEEVKSSIIDFMNGRFKNLLTDEGFRYDIIDSVLEMDESFPNIYDRARFIKENIETDNFKDAIEGHTRISNLASKAESKNIDEKVLEKEDLEIYGILENAEKKNEEIIEKRDYESGLNLLASLKNPINKYMDSSMIMVDKESLKNSRLGILKRLEDLFNSFCDFSKIVE